MAILFDLAKVLRSKNSGPFEITMDVLFHREEDYYRVKNSGVINEETICKIYNLSSDRLCSIIFFDQAIGFKVTMLREVSSGSIGDRDVYGAQQHIPLTRLEV
ncbi:DUF4387 domain-containing protein [Peribacillus muralis]|uniref:DUF4387 domain-containing protein n=1 Tax=Peribacillus muralis TaxID=264697 RepID=UPI001F4EEDEB|nr:DUF4387 domain-containing protein [Peribacillus muralis]MCK1993294.1 DUF4387 domain-containing protein [Peribacillus muralis]MCK2013848.1 DUF4387 domain-containing protein [Peribacillus muralis]